MSLRVYNRKRKFDQTPEPKGKKKTKGKGHLRFVVQLHSASRLHYDFRLEFGGVFKSWAVPKGPSLNPLDQRLAVFVEDHPLDYGSFEGIIPKGNYGAGTVMVWDTGTYVERGSEGRKDSEEAMIKNFAKGHITFVLEGEKLKGEFALIQLKKDASGKSWLLVKKRDEYSTYKRSEIPNDLSVKTGRTLEQIAAASEKKGDIWLPNRKKGAVKAEAKPSPKKAVTKEKAKPAIKSATKPFERKSTIFPVREREEKTPRPPAKAKPGAMPRKIKPMQPTLSRNAEPGKNWIFDVHTDGVRALAEVEGKKVHLYSRSGLPFDKKYPEVADDLRGMNETMLLDGEIAANGKSAVFHVFDLLYFDGQDLRSLPLKERRKRLSKIKFKGKHVKQVTAAKSGPAIAKDPESRYHSGISNEWLLVETGATRKKSKPQVAAPVDEARLTNPDKIYFPQDGITKGDLFEYYRSISPYILPYLKDRPESLNRHPNGIDQPGFYQKDMTGYKPRWLKTERIFSESSARSIDYVVVQDERSLLHIVNLGCIEIHPWFSRMQNLNKPDFIVIDLDPDDSNTFKQTVEVAHAVHELLDDIGAKNFVKTSGATGIHIGIPTGAKYDYDTVRAFAEDVCNHIQTQFPKITSVVRNPAKRRGKIYLDFMQNRRAQTLAAAWCVRPRPGAPVSMPLEWEELTPRLKPEQFHLKNALRRAEKSGDPFLGVLGAPIDVAKCAKTLLKKLAKA